MLLIALGESVLAIGVGLGTGAVAIGAEHRSGRMSNRGSPLRSARWGELHGTLRQLTKHAHRSVNGDLRLRGQNWSLPSPTSSSTALRWPTRPTSPAGSTWAEA